MILGLNKVAVAIIDKVSPCGMLVGIRYALPRPPTTMLYTTRYFLYVSMILFGIPVSLNITYTIGPTI